MTIDFDKMENTLVEMFEAKADFGVRPSYDPDYLRCAEVSAQIVHAIVALRQERRDSEKMQQRTVRRTDHGKGQ